MNQFCQCEKDGFCPRYQRPMRGRFRQICQGIDCDLGTAASFREQWARESSVSLRDSKNPTPLLLKTNQAPGDAVVMTAAIYSLHRSHPGRYLTAVESPYPEVFAHNPDVVEATPDALPLEMHYPAIHQSNERAIHFMQGFCEHLGYALGVNVPLLTNRPHLYFNEPAPSLVDYWVVCSGGKRDLTNKLWGHDRYQRVVGELLGQVEFIQVGDRPEDHRPLRGTRSDMVGLTSLRSLFDLVRMSRGVLCGVSLLMHIAAALEKPCVVVAGGREPVAWNAYPRQHYLHTVGELGCSDPQGHVGGACWRSRTVPLGDNETLDKDPCLRVVNGSPECMTRIAPEDVARLILRINQQI